MDSDSYQEFDVYLSFGGSDILRTGFGDLLYAELTKAGIRVFTDDEEVRPRHVQEAIEHSKISIPILSRSYGDSKWCLRDLALIMECRRTRNQLVLPIYYDVSAYDVQRQVGSYGEAFCRHEMEHDAGTVEQWRAAIATVGELKGWELKETNESEAQLVKMVVVGVKRVLKSSNVVPNDFEVFLNFYGADTQEEYADYLYNTLTDAGIRVFRGSENLQVGKEIALQIREVINQAKISIPIFSRNYASSRWCLQELTLIMEVMRKKHQIVRPIYYDVTKTEVQTQEGRYCEAISQHLHEVGSEKIQQWKEALTDAGKLESWNMANNRQGKLLKLFVKEVLRELRGSNLMGDSSVGKDHTALARLPNVDTNNVTGTSAYLWERPTQSSYGEFDVYLSFRSLDARTSRFEDLLYTTLIEAGISVFRVDEEVRTEEEIAPQIQEAIIHSKISIPLLSQNYADSKWCLGDLALIMECRRARNQWVLPIYYDVSAYDVQRQVGSYGEAFWRHEMEHDDAGTVEQWRAALAAVGELKGWDLKETNGSEAQLVKMVVAEVKRVLKSSNVVPNDFEVFLNFYGADTQEGYADFLYNALTDAGIRVFRGSENLQVGKEIALQIREVINQAKISIPIFSRNYASSRWCLQELTLIMEVMRKKHQIVQPIYYDVTKTEVQTQEGRYCEAISEHLHEVGSEKIQQWKEALTDAGKLKSWNMADNRQVETLLKLVVKEVVRELRGSNRVADSSVGKDHTALVGLPTQSSYEEFDVYLSFRGSDVRTGFAHFLHAELTKAGIRVFIDDEEARTGEEIAPQIEEAIKHSKISIPILTRSYGDSKWCLGDLALMMECRRARSQWVLPIFYDVSSYEVRKQVGNYGKAFHEIEHDRETVEQWKAALVAVGKLRAWDLKETNGSEAQLLKVVVAEVKRVLKSPNVVPNDFEVFLSFYRGDTRGGFADFLKHALIDAGIRVFRGSTDLRVGIEVPVQIKQVINQAKICISIFSPDYASSRSCLDQLTQVMEVRRNKNQILLPVYYDVTQTEVQTQEGIYHQVFSDHVRDQAGSKRVDRWREVLADAGKLKGWDLTNTNRYQGQVIKLIVAEALRLLKGSRLDLRSNNLVGIDAHLESITGKLDVDASDVRMLGIHGIGGIGKTTLANVIYKRIYDQFGACCFLKSIRDTSSQYGLKHLECRLAADILGYEEQYLANAGGDVNYLIQQSLQNKRVLLVLDDVDDANQIAELAGNLDRFGLGSRIIVTTRNRAILPKGAHEYEVGKLDQHDAFRLFCKNAFQQDSPPDRFVALSHKIVEATEGLPLSVETIGSYLFAVEDSVWEKALHRLKTEPGIIRNRLMISYDSLDDKQKQMFLDIACFFVGSDVRIADRMWRHCNIFSEDATKVLTLMSIIKIEDDNKTLVHGHFRDLAREIVHRQNVNEPGKRSRVWGEDALKLLHNKEGTTKVEAIRLDNQKGSQPYVISGDKFEGLSNLRYLDLANAILDGEFHEKISNLRWLGWHGHTQLHVPASLDVEKLVVLDLSRSAIDKDWNVWTLLKEAKNLEVLDLTSCHRLTVTPNLSSFPRMKRLILRDCILLHKIDRSVGDLTELISLDVRSCLNLTVLPKELGSLGQMQELLMDQSSIEKVPELDGLKNLETFSAKSCKSLRQIPKSFGYLVKLQKLLLDNCKKLVEIPNTIGQLESLKELSLSRTRVVHLPDPIQKWRSLEVLNVDHCPIRKLPASLWSLTELQVLNASECLNLAGEIPSELEKLTSLRILRLDHTNNIDSLPATIEGLPHLHTLDLEGCVKLQSLPRLPVSLVNLKVTFTSSSMTVPNLANLINLEQLQLQRRNSFSVTKHPSKDGSSSSTSDTVEPGYEYEVFLSFRGPDTRVSFTDVLYKKLEGVGVRTFRDDEELRVGKQIGPNILQAINQSKISIPIFSKGYASSKWCLMEAEEMVKCMDAETRNQEVFPIFFDVTPEVVKHQTESYAESFLEHEKLKKHEPNTIQEWRNALTRIGARKGRCVGTSGSSPWGTVLQDVVSWVLKTLKKPYLDVSKNLVGIEDHVERVVRLSDADPNEVRMIGLWGMGGVGKSTVAKFIFNQLANKFEYRCFLENIRGTSVESKERLLTLQTQLVSDILGYKCEKFSSCSEGMSVLNTRLRGKKVLILIDDVYQKEQLEYLVGNLDWFGPGSRIFVTTREVDVLRKSEVVEWIEYEVEEMSSNNSFILFCKHAFRQDFPLPGLERLSADIVEATGGLPLAIQAIGSSLYKTTKKGVWEEARNSLKTKTNIHDTLKVSYDALNHKEQEVFLDIACLFKGMDKRIPCHMWKARKFNPKSTLEELCLRSLIKIKDDNILWVHDCFIDLGREIVCQKSDSKLGRRSRLWCSEEAVDVLKTKKGTEEVKAIRLDRGSDSEKHCFSHPHFEKLTYLEFLELGDASLCGDLQESLQSLRWLSWHNLLNTPSCLDPENLVILDLSKSEINSDWIGWSLLEEAEKLEVLNLSSCHQLTRTPDFSAFLKMKRLILEDCRGLVEVSPSIEELENLEFLDLRNCSSLKHLPKELGSLEELTELLLDGSSIAELPISGNMTKLEIVSAKSCGSLTEIPDALGELNSLKELNLSRTGVVYLPDSLENLGNLEVVNIDHCLITELPMSLWKLKQLEVVSASGCRNLKGDISCELGSVDSLRVLRLDRTSVTSIPESIKYLSRLRTLDLKDCMKLQSLPTLPSSLVELKVTLTSSPNLQNLSNLKELEIVYCGELSKVLMDINKFSKIEKLTITKRQTRGL